MRICRTAADKGEFPTSDPTIGGDVTVRRHTTWLAVCITTLALVPPAAAATHYTVRQGDTLTAIAHRYHTSLGRLARMNHLQPYAILRIGTVLRVPGKAHHHHRRHRRRRQHRQHRQLIVHVVRPGETLSGIAARHHISLARLARLNHRTPYGVLVIGTRLRVPFVRHAHRHRHHGHHRHHQRAGDGLRARWRGRHVVRRGETLSGLGARYRTSIRRLARANHLRIHRFLLVGTVLRVPLHGHRGRPPRRHRHHHRSSGSVPRLLDRWSRHYRVDRLLVRAVAWQESNFRPGLTSSAGAWGVMQVMPMTWAYAEQALIGHPVRRTTGGGIRVGVAYLRSLLWAFGGSERLAVAAYYQGPTSVRIFGILPGSRFYVRHVLYLRGRV
jgi:LysM repeat protein